MNRYLKTLVLIVSSLSALLCLSVGQAVPLDAHPALQRIAKELAEEGFYSETDVASLISAAEMQPTVLNAMKNPAEVKFTWGKYRKIFLKTERIQQGVEFWQSHEELLDRAETEYGVPAEVIVAILGVETKFGRVKGSHRVLDSLVSLVVDFPRRSEFFASELKHFLKLCKENNIDPLVVKGSYAGAMGFPQFIASSYRNYAVDFSGDGVVDLVDDVADAIGSVANYFAEHGWKAGQPVTSTPVVSVPRGITDRANRKRNLKYSASELRGAGAALSSNIADDEMLNVLMLNAGEQVNDPVTSRVYVVRAGDTACEIAEQFEIPCRQLMSLNNLGSSGKIYRGQQLVLPKIASDNAGGWKVQAASTDGVREQYFFTHHNFYVITRYNHSVLYGMAVHDLSQAIGEEYSRQRREGEQ